MKKIVAIVFLLMVGAIVYWLNGNMNYLLRKAIVRYGSEMLQADVNVDQVSIDLINGEGRIVDLMIGNPHGFKTPHAIKVKEIRLKVDPASLTSEVVRIREVRIQAPDIIYEKGETLTNFESLQRNVAAYTADTKETAQQAQDAKKDEPGKRLIVDRFVMENAVAQASSPLLSGNTMRVELPDLHMKNVGKTENGITPAEFGQRVASAMNKQLMRSVSFERLGNALKETGESAIDAVKSLF